MNFMAWCAVSATAGGDRAGCHLVQADLRFAWEQVVRAPSVEWAASAAR